LTLAPCLLSPCYTPPPPSLFYTLSLHDALPISFTSARRCRVLACGGRECPSSPKSFESTLQLFDRRHARPTRCRALPGFGADSVDRKSTRLNSSHQIISYAVFCLKKKIIIHNVD